MRKIDLYFESWEIESLANLESYLTKNCEKAYEPAPVKNAGTNEIIGKSTRFDFKDLADVVLVKYDVGRGWVIVLGNRGLEERLNELKDVLGYRRLEPESQRK